MVYLREIIKQNRETLLQFNNLESVAYLYIINSDKLFDSNFELSPEEQIALKGYKGEDCQENEIRRIISRSPIKGVNALSNIYKLSGLYLASKSLLKGELINRFKNASIKEKYFLSKIEPDLLNNFNKNLQIESEPISLIIKNIIDDEVISNSELDNAISDVIDSDIDIQILIILEDLEKKLLQTKYLNQDANNLVRNILNNFSNAIKKITQNRRKNHNEYEINDEYDVQDILYVILKSVFPNLKDEDPIQKSGGKGTRIDLILREEEILIEVKMIKTSDYTESKFIDELKIDIESYHGSPWIKTLFCFVYDPFNKTRDIANFTDLNGIREKSGKRFNVEVIVVK